MTWETVIGLEVHAQLHTNTKLFSNAATTYGAAPNAQAHIIDAGFPGTLPVLNREAVYLAIQFGFAIGATINQLSYFERKNYVYPDLPKGYQISQFQRPIVSNGYLDILDANGHSKRIIIERAHLEEDAGKSLHNRSHQTGIDLNRAGIPLLEIVTTPCLSSAAEVVHYLKTLHQLLRFLKVCNGNMQEGSFRCDVNLSLKRPNDPKLGTRVELKNINSFRFIEKAILYEQHRQAGLLDNQQTVTQETRLFHENNNSTQSMRDKENTADYRYFPDPDLLPIFLQESVLNDLAKQLPELPNAIIHRLSAAGITNQEDLEYLLSSPALIHYYDTVKQHSHAPTKLLINWLKGPLSAELNYNNMSFETISVSPTSFAELLNHLADNSISTKLGKEILTKLFTSNETITTLLAAYKHAQKNNVDLQALIDAIVTSHPKQTAQYLAGDEKILSFLIGQTLKASKGQGDPKEIQALLVKAMNTKR